MRLTVVTPLFPPDVAAPAVYAKKLCTELAIAGHEVTCLHFGRLPEAVAGVAFISCDKEQSRLRRVSRLHRELATLAKSSDALIVLNGPSVELPALLLTRQHHIPTVLVINDQEAVVRNTGLVANLHRRINRAATAIITPPSIVLTKPERHPLVSESETAYQAYQAAWPDHIQAIIQATTV